MNLYDVFSVFSSVHILTTGMNGQLYLTILSSRGVQYKKRYFQNQIYWSKKKKVFLVSQCQYVFFRFPILFSSIIPYGELFQRAGDRMVLKLLATKFWCLY